ncbi:MAG: hypothetical protein L0Z62_14745 [Gemmataceae bacterium]|nr:hypothetical protein [Gemmataceae bacterium]
MVLVLCEVQPYGGTISTSVAVRDTSNVPSFVEVERDFVTQRHGQHYLPVGLVYRDKERGVALIEFPVEAASGAHRIWVPLSSLLETKGTST